MAHNKFTPLATLMITMLLSTGCAINQVVPTLSPTIRLPTPLPLASITQPTSTLTAKPTITVSTTPTARPTQTVNPTPTFHGFSSIKPGTYILINSRKRHPDKFYTDVFSMDGTFQARLAEEGGPIDPGGKKMVVWDSFDTFVDSACSGIRILDLDSHVVTTDPFPIGYNSCVNLNWTRDGKSLIFNGDVFNIAEYNLVTHQTTVLLDASFERSSGFDALQISPDGRWLAFYWLVEEFDKKYLKGLYILDLACRIEPSTCIKRAFLLYETYRTRPLAWTPDGDLTRNDNNALQVFDATKKSIVDTIWLNPGIDIYQFAWSPDKKWIVYGQGEPDSIAVFPSTGDKFSYLEGLNGEVLGWLVVPSLTPIP